MVLGYHLIITAYGFWLPNDPRGSWSDFVGSWELYRFGGATKITVRQSVAARPHDVALRRAAKQVLKYPEVDFTGEQAKVIGDGFGQWVRHNGITLWACAVLPEHVHLVVARHRYHVEQVANLLKGAATRALMAAGCHPFAQGMTSGQRPPTVWARGQWKVYLNSAADIRRAIRYVEENPLKEGKRRQVWSFVTPYEGGDGAAV